MVSTSENVIQVYVKPLGDKISCNMLESLEDGMKSILEKACVDIPFASFKNDRCEGRIVTESGGDIRPPIIISTEDNPICFRMDSFSKDIPSHEIKVISEAIHKQFRIFLG